MKKVSVLEERGRPTSGEEATAGRFVTYGHGLPFGKRRQFKEKTESFQEVMRKFVLACRFLLTKVEKCDKIYIRRHIVNIYANRPVREVSYNDYNN